MSIFQMVILRNTIKNKWFKRSTCTMLSLEKAQNPSPGYTTIEQISNYGTLWKVTKSLMSLHVSDYIPDTVSVCAIKGYNCWVEFSRFCLLWWILLHLEVKTGQTLHDSMSCSSKIHVNSNVHLFRNI